MNLDDAAGAKYTEYYRRWADHPPLAASRPPVLFTHAGAGDEIPKYPTRLPVRMMARETGAWMPMYWADYFGDTTHLTTEQHGAYLLLIGTYWRHGGPLPDDNKWLASVTKMHTNRWGVMRKTLAPLFDIIPGVGWTHKRLENEILKSSNRLNSARAAGKAGGIATFKQRARASSTTTVTEEEDTPPFGTSPIEPAPEVSQPKPRQTKGNGHDRKRGSRLSEDWSPDEKDSQFACNLGLDPGDTADRFRDYWIANPGAAGIKLNWSATWRNWCRRETDRVQRGVDRSAKGSPPTGVVAGTLADLADLEGDI